MTPFGAPMKEQFLIDPSYRNLNHGSFGTQPRDVQSTQQALQVLSEQKTDVFIRQTQPQLLTEARTAIADYLNVPRNTVVFVKNATTGVNTILHNLIPAFASSDVILYFDTVYGAVERGLCWLTESRPVQLHKIHYTLPKRHDAIVQLFVDAIRDVRGSGRTPRLAVFDTIVSNPGVRFPFEDLVRLCRQEAVLSLVDAAHGVGHIPLDLGVLQPDFLTSNCHKWLYTPRSSAILYVAPQHHAAIRSTLPASWGFIPHPGAPAGVPRPGPPPSGSTAFETLFEHVATTDDTAYLCVPAALRFRRDVCGGEAAIQEYLERLANEGAEVVARSLRTEVMTEPGLREGERSALRACGMANVRLPFVIDETRSGRSDSEGGDATVTAAQADRIASLIRDSLLRDFDTFVPVFRHGDYLWTRISAQVYLDRSDFEWLGRVLSDVCTQAYSTAVAVAE
ncbi:pyridoxal phosphate-dependent transferase [Aspergillus ambiguus]|uniref:putative aminotransferase family protein (LolT) n=1 Tax=Aspergillus ambiguus TaxID=176160 RepID=UPI003CCCFB53